MKKLKILKDILSLNSFPYKSIFFHLKISITPHYWSITFFILKGKIRFTIKILYKHDFTKKLKKRGLLNN